jgi:hypothetical protein
MGKQSIGDFIAKNNIVRFERTSMSDKKPTDDGYEAYRYIFEEEPLDLTEEEKKAIRVQIAMERALNEQHGDRQ